MPKVLQINVTANWGSTGRIAEQIGIRAIKHDWESWIAYGRYANSSDSRLIQVGCRWNTYSHYLMQRLLDNEGLCSISATRRLIKEIKRIEPNIVHLHNIHDHYLNYKLLFEYLNKTNIKVVWTFHDFWAVTGHCMHFVSKCCSRYQCGCHDCPMKNVFPKSLVDRSRKNWELKKDLIGGCKNLTIVPVSEWVGKMIGLSFVKDKRIQVINNGIDLDVFYPRDLTNYPKYQVLLTRTYGKFVIMSVANQWKFDKGLEDYKRIAKLMKEDEIIVLVGVEDNILVELPENIIGIKRTSDTGELAALYTLADVITIFSAAETFGLTVVEGYACGTPAVVYNNTAPPDLITADTGFVVENHNYKAAYDVIKEIKHKGKNSFSDACKKLARKKYDNKVSCEKYIELYEGLLNE